MATPPLLLALLLILSATFSQEAIASDPNATDFIRRCCASTLYPKLCYNSLSPYAAAVHQSPLTIAVKAANVSLAMIKDTSRRAAAIQRGSTGRLGAALRDCVDFLRTAAQLTRDSVAEIQKLGPGASSGGPGIAWDFSNAQTWMSAALTNEDTCIDGFTDIGAAGSPAAKAVCGRVGSLKQYTSNALALLNALVHG